MKKATFLLLGILLYLALEATDRRAVRSNWPCMDPLDNCIGVDEREISFGVTLRFRVDEYQALPPMFLKAHGSMENLLFPIDQQSINNPTNSFIDIIGYTKKNEPIYDTLVDIQFMLTFDTEEAPANFDYGFSLASTGGTVFPLSSYPRLMAMIAPEPGWHSYVVDEQYQIEEVMTKTVCSTPICNNSQTIRKPAPSLEHDLTIAPNPFVERITLKYHTSTEVTTRIDIMDIQGKTVRQIVRNDLVGLQSEEVDLSDLTAGVYLCRITNDDGIQTKKLVKQTE